MGDFRVEPLSTGRDRSSFDCGAPVLNDYLAARAGQDARRRIATSFVAIEKTPDEVAGYYTLSACGMTIDDLPADLKKKLPRYPTVPAILIGRLAVDLRFQGQRLGETLLVNAFRRMLDAELPHMSRLLMPETNRRQGSTSGMAFANSRRIPDVS